MQLGDIKLTTISGGRFRSDGGTMFGVVPRALWARVAPPDESNRIPQATNCMLVDTGAHRVLIDTGYGSKLSAKERRIHSAEEGDPLSAALAERGISAEDIDTVILSHLHFDHAGGATRVSENARLVPTFPNAQYVTQRREWETALAGKPELRGAYPQENLLPLNESGQLRLVEGDVEIVPGISARVTGGHTTAHQSLVITSGDETAVFVGDVCPTAHHLRQLWCMAYDVDLLETRRSKAQLLGEIADAGWWALLDHDPQFAAVRLQRDDQREFVVSEAVETL